MSADPEDKDAEISRLRARVVELLKANEVEVNRRRAAERGNAEPFVSLMRSYTRWAEQLPLFHKVIYYVLIAVAATPVLCFLLLASAFTEAKEPT